MMITIALAKGRLLTDLLPHLQRAHLAPAVDLESTRSLIIPSTNPSVQFLIIRATDVPTFVRHGAAHMGVCGRDMLMEQTASDLFQPCDLPFGHCRLSLALPHRSAATWKVGMRNNTAFPLRIATKYPNIAQEWFARRQQNVHLIKLYGSMEIAPAMGLSDGIIDLVSSGATLRENHLSEVEVIAPISARLIVNRSAMKTQYPAIQPMVAIFEKMRKL